MEKRVKNKPTQTVTDVDVSPRRKFLNWLWLGLGIVAVAELVWVILLYLHPIRTTPSEGESGNRMMAGRVDGFVPNTVTAFPRGHFYLACLEDGGFLAIHRKCTHLGCTVHWDAPQNMFLCACHGGAFALDGTVKAGPPPRPMDQLAYRIDSGNLLIEMV